MPRKKLAESAWPQARHHATGIPIGEQAIDDGECVVGGCSGMRRILSLGASAQPPEKDAWLAEAIAP